MKHLNLISLIYEKSDLKNIVFYNVFPYIEKSLVHVGTRDQIIISMQRTNEDT